MCCLDDKSRSTQTALNFLISVSAEACPHWETEIPESALLLVRDQVFPFFFQKQPQGPAQHIEMWDSKLFLSSSKLAFIEFITGFQIRYFFFFPAPMKNSDLDLKVEFGN